jgi:alpha-L-rhamnosidase
MGKKLVCFINNSFMTAGIPLKDLRFGWYPEDAFFPAFQTAYRIIITPDYPGGGQVYYDSGEIESDVGIVVPYDGPALLPAKKYILSIYVRYNDKSLYESGPIRIITGLGDNWSALWISNPRPAPVNDISFYRKHFSIDPGIKNALLYISAHSFCRCWINGKQVTGAVTPAPSHIYRDKYYLTYDISGLLRPGANIACCMLYWQNSRGQSLMDGLPGLLFQLHLALADGSERLVKSDQSWLVLNDTPYRSGMPFQQIRKVTPVMEYNCGHEAAHWLDDDYKDGHWEKAVLSGINVEQWTLHSQIIPENISHEEYNPLCADIQRRGYQVFDAGKIVSGWVRLSLKGIKGQRVGIRYSEELNPFVGGAAHDTAGECTDTYYDWFILSGEDDTDLAADYSFKSFRYFEVLEFPELIDPGAVTVVSAGTNIGGIGEFSCSDTVLNQVFEACLQTQKNNAVNQLVDCPHREQSQFMQDTSLQVPTLLFNFDAFPMLNKILQDFTHAQLPDGRMPIVFPTNFRVECLTTVCPEYDLSYIMLLWDLYSYYGDVRILERYYHTARKTLDYSLSKIDSETNLVERGTGWHISDWPSPQVDETSSFLTIENCLVHRNLLLMARIGDILGRAEDAQLWRDQAWRLNAAIMEQLYQSDKDLFFDGLGSQDTSQAASTVAVHCEVVPRDILRRILDSISGMPHTCSIRMSYPLLTMLFEHDGYEKYAWKILSGREIPGWCAMVLRGYKTTWEGFAGLGSHSHAWSGYPARLMQQYIAGARAARAGESHFEIRPYIPEGLEYAKAKVITPCGPVCAGWQKKEKTVLFTIAIPANATAVFTTPKVCVEGKSQVSLGPGLHQIELPLLKGGGQ